MDNNPEGTPSVVLTLQHRASETQYSEGRQPFYSLAELQEVLASIRAYAEGSGIGTHSVRRAKRVIVDYFDPDQGPALIPAPLLEAISSAPAVLNLLTFARNAPAFDPGEGDWHDSETAYSCGLDSGYYEAAVLVRMVLASLGLEAPAGDDPVLMEAGDGSWKWTAGDQALAADKGGWELNECGDGQIVIVADDDEGVFTGLDSNLKADAHVRSVARLDPPPKEGDNPYHQVCIRAVFIADATLAACEADALEHDPGLAEFAAAAESPPLKPDPAPDPERLAREGLALLTAARERFEAAGSRRTLDRVRSAISSGKGAVRAAGYRKSRLAGDGLPKGII